MLFRKPPSRRRPASKLRAPYYRWLFFTAGPVEAALTNKALGFVVPPDRERMMGYGNIAQALDTLEAAVSHGEYLVGDSFTAADLYVGSHIGFGMMFGTLGEAPGFREILATRQQPAGLPARRRNSTMRKPRN